MSVELLIHSNNEQMLAGCSQIGVFCSGIGTLRAIAVYLKCRYKSDHPEFDGKRFVNLADKSEFTRHNRDDDEN